MAVTFTVTNRWIYNGKRFSQGTMAMAGEAAGGAITLPASTLPKMGFVRQLDSIEFTGQADAANQYYVLFQPPTTSGATMKLLCYEEEPATADAGPLPIAPAAALTDQTFDFFAVGW